MSADFTDAQLAELDREVGGLIANLRDDTVSRARESEARIERILRRARLEKRIKEESTRSGRPDLPEG